MKLAGLTGGIATGKSTCARFFRKLGVSVIDTDKVAHAVIKKGKPAYKKIVALFGSGILKRSGEIDRTLVADIVFRTQIFRRKLEKIVHPEIWKEVKKSVFTKKGEFIIVEVPLLFETGWEKKFDDVVVVCCSKKVQLKRCPKRFRLRLNAQMPLSLKVKKADYIIDNSHSLASTKYLVKVIFKQLVDKYGST
jgi:dephospho-CoA kinase